MGLVVSESPPPKGRGCQTRRWFLAESLSVAIAPRWTSAQAPKLWRIGVLGVGLPGYGVVAQQNSTPPTERPIYMPVPSFSPPVSISPNLQTLKSTNSTIYLNWQTFIIELARLGHRSGHDVVFVERIAADESQPLERLAAELVTERVDLIIAASGSLGVLAAKQATSSIPIVMFGPGDAVQDGIVSSLARPGGNVTGNSLLGSELAVKRLELLIEVVGRGARLMHLLHESLLKTPSWSQHLRSIEGAASAGGASGVVFETVRGSADLEAAILRAKKQGVRALSVDDSPFLTLLAPSIAALTLQHQLPGIAGAHAHAEAGLLLAYCIDTIELAKKTAQYIDKIIKGATPADLPVEQPTRFELIVNLLSAKAIGTTVPKSILQRATRLVQ